MKKILIITVIMALAFTVCDEKDNNTDNDNEEETVIGTTGQGGGNIFYNEGLQFMECSGELGNFTWDEAVIAVNNYKGGGYEDWRLPNRTELELMKILKQKGIGGFSDEWYKGILNKEVQHEKE